MISDNIKKQATISICPECKNEINLIPYPAVAEGMIIECDHCGMTLLVKRIGDDGKVVTEIVDQGK